MPTVWTCPTESWTAAPATWPPAMQTLPRAPKSWAGRQRRIWWICAGTPGAGRARTPWATLKTDSTQQGSFATNVVRFVTESGRQGKAEHSGQAVCYKVCHAFIAQRYIRRMNRKAKIPDRLVGDFLFARGFQVCIRWRTHKTASHYYMACSSIVFWVFDVAIYNFHGRELLE